MYVCHPIAFISIIIVMPHFLFIALVHYLRSHKMKGLYKKKMDLNTQKQDEADKFCSFLDTKSRMLTELFLWQFVSCQGGY